MISVFRGIWGHLAARCPHGGQNGAQMTIPEFSIVESGKVPYDVIEPDNLHLQKMGKTLQNIH